MDDLDSPGVCVSPSPRLSGEGNGDANPFATPNASTTSFHSSQQRSAIMAESTSSPDGIDSVLTPTSNNSRGEETPTTATHLVVPKPRRAGAGEGPSTTAPPPPKPLDLPEPRTPPPRTETPHANKPPEPIPPPAVLRNEEEEEEVMRPSRWWTDWVCGCVESGDHQVSVFVLDIHCVANNYYVVLGWTNESFRVGDFFLESSSRRLFSFSWWTLFFSHIRLLCMLPVCGTSFYCLHIRMQAFISFHSFDIILHVYTPHSIMSEYSHSIHTISPSALHHFTSSTVFLSSFVFMSFFASTSTTSLSLSISLSLCLCQLHII